MLCGNSFREPPAAATFTQRRTFYLTDITWLVETIFNLQNAPLPERPSEALLVPTFSICFVVRSLLLNEKPSGSLTKNESAFSCI